MPIQSAITLDTFPTTSQTRTVTLTGKNTSDIASISVTGAPASVTQLTSTTWKAEVRLAIGANKLLITGTDVSGNVSSTISITITVNSLTLEEHRVFNVFDEFGVFLSLPRLPGEKNLPYRNRLLDVNVHIADTTLRGMTYGTSRELGERIRDAAEIRSPHDDILGEARALGGAFRIGPVYLDLLSSLFLQSDCLRVEPATQSIILTKPPPNDVNLKIHTSQGDLIAAEDWELDVRRKTVRFLTHEYNDLEVTATYEYMERISLADKDLTALKAAVEAFTDSDGEVLFEFTITWKGEIPAENLVQIPFFLGIIDQPVTLEATPIRVRELHNHDYQDAQYNEHGHAIGTKLEAWAARVNNESRVVWGSAVLGSSIWEPLGETPRLGALPHLTDAQRGHWRCLKGDDGTRFTRKDYRRYNGICPNDGETLEYHGVLPSEFQSGTGTQDDLKVLKIVAV